MRGDSRFYALDGIRGLAALAVAAFHYGSVNDIAPFPGFLAVDLFFVLSGFVIAMSYAAKLEQGLGVAGFMIVRLERLYPLWLLGCLVALAYFLTTGVATAAPKWFAGITVANLLMLPAPAETSTFPLNIPGWSLFFELLVNFAFALCLWRLRTSLLAAIMVVAGVVLIMMSTPPHLFNMGSEWSTFFGGFPRTLYSFLAGVLIFRFGAAAGRRATWLAGVPVVLSLALILWVPPTAMVAAVEGAAVLILFPVLVGLAARWEVPAALERISARLGDISYPLYVLHVPLMFIGTAAHALTGSPEAGLALYLVATTLISLPAAAADRVVRAWLRRVRLARSARLVQSAA